MDKEQVRLALPTEPPEGLVDWAREHCGKELGPQYAVWRSERNYLPAYPEDVLVRGRMRGRSAWFARVECTACGGEHITMKIPGADAVRFIQGDDGILYEMIPGETEITEDAGIYDVFDGETFTCPHCFREVELIHARKVTGGRTKRFLVVQLAAVQGYAALIYWLVYRTLDEFAMQSYGARPADSFVLDEKGRIHRYTMVRRGGAFACDQYLQAWKLCSSNEDTISKPYNDWGSVCNRKVGGDLWPTLADLTGTTGEKTGLDDYLSAGGWWPISYLKLWNKFPQVENLVRSPHAQVVAGIVQEAQRFAYDVGSEARGALDLEEKKPNRMLRIGKEDYRMLARKGICLSFEKLGLWRRYRRAGGKESIVTFLELSGICRSEGTLSILQLMEKYGDCDFPKVIRYLEKNGMQPWESTWLMDSRRMAAQIAGGRPLYPEELWPRNLAAAHDRYARILRDRAAAEAAARNALKDAQDAELDEKFRELKNRLKALEWSDGDLCVVLPEQTQDLIREGDVLRHCVGGYGKQHVSGTDRIFFIRRYRRPERSYYTLDICMVGGLYERQLHGYGNERHGLHKQYRHSIPKKVRAFCDRWKAEILTPWYEKECKREDKTA